MGETLDYYDAEYAKIAETYDSVEFRPVVTRVLQHAPERGTLLDLGCGSGRDAAFYLELGYDVTALDGSRAMLGEAARRHPELADRLVHHELPAPLPFESDTFDLVISMAVIMHLKVEEVPATFGEMRRVTRPGGVVAYSANTERQGLDDRGNDAKGRHFSCLPAAEWKRLHEAVGLRTLGSWENEDISGRPGIRWATFVCGPEK